MQTSSLRKEMMPLNRATILNEALSHKELELIIFPTERCNFRCTYCYEDFAIGRMAQPIRDGIKRLIAARGDELEILQLSWFGGEPLQAYEVIEEISQNAVRLSRAHPFSHTMHLTTNAYRLTQERILRFYELGTTSYQVTLDGLGRDHDRTRIRADGAGTFDQIWNNLLTFNRLHSEGKLNGCKVILRLHAHPENFQSMSELSRHISSQLNPAAFSVAVRPIAKLGGANDKSLSVFNRQDAENAMSIVSASLAPYIGADEGEIYVCYAAKANSFAIRADGRIAKCTVALNDDVNTVGGITVDGSLEIDASKMGAWLKPLATLNAKDLGYPIS